MASDLALLLSRRLRALRLSQKLTQFDFAQLAEVNYKKYQRYESGRSKEIRLSQVERLAACYGLEAWQLIGREEPKATRHPRDFAEEQYGKEEALFLAREQAREVKASASDP